MAKRFRQNMIATGVILPFAFSLVQLAEGADKIWGLPSSLAWPLSLGGVLGITFFAWKTWRCPACQASLGRAWPRQCPSCGADLR